MPTTIVEALEPAFQKAVYGEKGAKGKKRRQTLLLGAPEVEWLKQEAERLAAEATDAKSAETAVAELEQGLQGQYQNPARSDGAARRPGRCLVRAHGHL